MKARKFSQVTLLIGLLVGALTLWVGTAPAGVTGDLITGGWETCWVPGDSAHVAASYWDCDPCDGTAVRECREGGSPPCSGGYITIVMAASAGATPHSAGGGDCYGIDLECGADDGDCY